MEQYYELWGQMMAAGEELPFWQSGFVKFYQAFIEADRWKLYLEGLGTTLWVAALSLMIGLVLGVFLAIIRTTHDQQRPDSKNPFLGLLDTIARVYITVIRGTPMMVQLLIMAFVIFSSSREYAWIGALTLGLNSGAYVAEIVRGGLMSLDRGQMEAGRSLGMSYAATMWHIVVPQSFKAILPSLGNELIVLLKDTSLLTAISARELLYAAEGIANRNYEYLFPYLGVAATYLVLVMFLSYLLKLLERRLQQGDRH